LSLNLFFRVCSEVMRWRRLGTTTALKYFSGVYNPGIEVSKQAIEITGLLRDWESGEQAALERLAPLVYDELRRLARHYMRREGPGKTLQTTALVNEAYLRLVGGTNITWRDRAHFFAVSANVMRRILVEAARARASARRGGRLPRVELNEELDASQMRGRELISLDDSLQALAQIDPRKARVIELRFFGGLSVEETAEVLKISSQSVMRDWKLAKAWLSREMGAKQADAPSTGP
jgi:RNA polymerase sigma-70 factor, ECF subfamily